MGAQHSNSQESVEEVSLDDFQILRAIGKGSFSKVCIVQKKNTNRLYAMKYMNKQACLAKDAVHNVAREVNILAELNHPFLVNLWFTFQDQDDMFMVFDLLMGGDLRYHLTQKGTLEPEQVKLYVCELALVLDYLQKKRIVHRDIKPDNILLDELGHAHLTDFNIATVLSDGSLATSSTGTKPYMAPEIYECSVRQRQGYSFSVDWWSLGVTVYELLRGRRPYEIRNDTTARIALEIFESTPLVLPSPLGETLINLVSGLLEFNPDLRTDSLTKLKSQIFLGDMRIEEVLRRRTKPTFVPPKDELNCDPTYELEEMIIESNPLHKKKKRGKTGRPSTCSALLAEGKELNKDSLLTNNDFITEFNTYNREKILKDEENRVRKLEEELGLRPQNDAVGKRLGRLDGD